MWQSTKRPQRKDCHRLEETPRLILICVVTRCPQLYLTYMMSSLSSLVLVPRPCYISCHSCHLLIDCWLLHISLIVLVFVSHNMHPPHRPLPLSLVVARCCHPSSSSSFRVNVCRVIVPRPLIDIVAPHCPGWCPSSHVFLIDCCMYPFAVPYYPRNS